MALGALGISSVARLLGCIFPAPVALQGPPELVSCALPTPIDSGSHMLTAHRQSGTRRGTRDCPMLSSPPSCRSFAACLELCWLLLLPHHG